jgi:hypothetical protein
MATITKWTGIIVLVAGLALTISVWGIGSSPAFGCDYANGWMTGGGSIFYGFDGKASAEYGSQLGSDGRVTHGFVVHCTPRNSDNLEIVDHLTGLNFHLLDLTATACKDDPNIEPNPPDAAFDTFEGWGVGRCKKTSGRWQPCSIHFIFTDGGERGGCLRDTAYILIQDQSLNTLLYIDNDVDCGNHQAHDGF